MNDFTKQIQEANAEIQKLQNVIIIKHLNDFFRADWKFVKSNSGEDEYYSCMVNKRRVIYYACDDSFYITNENYDMIADLSPEEFKKVWKNNRLGLSNFL